MTTIFPSRPRAVIITCRCSGLVHCGHYEAATVDISEVLVPDAEKAVKEAIARYGIDKPNEQARLAAQRLKEIG
jgi:hypothetical protein